MEIPDRESNLCTFMEPVTEGDEGFGFLCIAIDKSGEWR